MLSAVASLHCVCVYLSSALGLHTAEERTGETGETLKHIKCDETWLQHYKSQPHTLHAVIDRGLYTHCPKVDTQMPIPNTAE